MPASLSRFTAPPAQVTPKYSTHGAVGLDRGGDASVHIGRTPPPSGHFRRRLLDRAPPPPARATAVGRTSLIPAILRRFSASESRFIRKVTASEGTACVNRKQHTL
ncbi:hypothetical protein EVAR_28029_1 [Eumeta japonica]|uniref:Uncharacterized protein n=1 Tax=Eumeta variegata TaxID=151549 RepID=A0A4C1WC60_EUMVA|nr:hypothetical protein EVAR_28029_1 [Eumeta japonica]